MNLRSLFGPTRNELSFLLGTLLWCYGPVLSALAAALLFALADPVHEIMLVLAQDTLSITSFSGNSVFNFFRVVMSVIGILLMTWGIWHAVRYGVISSPRGRKLYEHDFAAHPGPVKIDKDLSWTPHIVAAFPLLGLVVGLMKTVISDEPNIAETIVLYGFLIFIVLLTAFVLRSSTFRDVSGKRVQTFMMAMSLGIGFAITTWLCDWLLPDGPFKGILLIVWIGFFLYFFFILLMTVDLSKAYDPGALIVYGNALGVPAIILLVNYFGSWPDGAGSFLEKAETVLYSKIDIIFVLFMALSIFTALYHPPKRELTAKNRKPHTGWGSRFAILLLALTVLSVPLTIVWPSVWTYGGPFFVGTIFFGAVAMNSAWVIVVSSRKLRGFPTILALPVIAVLFGGIGWSGGHRIQSVAEPEPQKDQVETDFASYEGAAKTWLEATSTDNGPIYLVAAEGGGLYAGYHAAYDLARRRSLAGDDNITDRVFAISGVSGGSVGAATYWALDRCDRASDCTFDGTPTDAVRKVLERDYLSPVVAGLLFTDFADTFLGFVARISKFERGVALKSGMKNAIQATFDKSTGQAFLSSIRSTAHETSPLLLINVTRLHDGNRLTFASIKNTELVLQGDAGNQDMSLADAVIASARFPVVTPPARAYFEGDKFAPAQLIDGGYVDNTGLDGLKDALIGLQRAQASLGNTREIRILIYSVVAEDETSRASYGVLTTPIVGLNATRSARNKLTMNAFKNDFSGEAQIYFCELDTEDFSLTLSWLLSKTTFATMRDEIDATGYCPLLQNG